MVIAARCGVIFGFASSILVIFATEKRGVEAFRFEVEARHVRLEDLVALVEPWGTSREPAPAAIAAAIMSWTRCAARNSRATRRSRAKLKYVVAPIVGD